VGSFGGRFEEEPLSGNVSAVSKVGDTVRRSIGPWTPAVHAILLHLEDAGFDGAPRVMGIDEGEREVLTYVPGEVPRRASPDVVTDRAIADVGRLLRRYHEAVAGFELPPGIRWHHEPMPGPKMVVCHNDLSPRNTVFRDGRPVAFLDWDFAAPGPPAWDVAHAGWQFIPLSDEEGCARHGWTSSPDRARRLQVLCDAYGLAKEDRWGFTDVVVRRMEATASGIEALAAEGVPAHERLVRDGIPTLVRADKDWVKRHAKELAAALARAASKRTR
jgi:Phosphotransferase enzyme family